MVYSVSVVGLGKQSLEDHIPAILESDLCTLNSICDIDKDKVKSLSKKLSVPGYSNIDELIKNESPDIAVIAIPHICYLEIVEKLAKANIHILKEKPFATSLEEAFKIDEILNRYGVLMQVSVQRRFHPIYTTFSSLVKHIGRVYSIEARYVMNIEDLESGWRSQKSTSGGGALIDMGYHYIDLFLWYFGLPDEIFARMAIGNRGGQKYDVEDTAMINFLYNADNNKKILGSFLVSRVYPIKEELITVIGTKGSIQLGRGVIRRINNNGDVLEELMRLDKWPSAPILQLDDFIKKITNKNSFKSPHIEHFDHVKFIEASYNSICNQRSISTNSIML